LEDRDRFLDYLKEIPNFLSIFIFPIFFMTIGPMLLDMSKTTGISSGDLSLIFTFFTVGSILGQLTSVFYNRKFKKITVILASYIFIIPLFLTLSFVKSLFLFYFLYFLTGYFAGVIWLQATKYILENKIKNKDRLTTIFLSFYPVGNITAPLIASVLIKNNLSWRYYYYITIVLVIMILVLYLVLKLRNAAVITQEDEEKINFRKIFFDKRINLIFIFGCILLLFYCTSETAIAAWSPTFFRSERAFDIQLASFAISIFWVSIFAGRMIVSFIAGRIKTNTIMLFLSILAFVSMVLLFFLKSKYAILTLMIFAGLGCSGIITLGISSASTVYQKGRGVLASIVFAGVNIGVSAAPFLTRFISGYSMPFSIMVAPVFMFLTAMIIIIKILYENKTMGV
jgi:MFS family permease